MLTTGPVDYSAAFLMGLLGGAHCVGMCGALVSGCFIRLNLQARHPGPHLAYQLARIGVYTGLGVAGATAGAALVSVGIVGAAQGLLQLFMGLVVVLVGLEVGGFVPWRLRTPGLSPTRMGNWLRYAAHKGPLTGAFLAGTMNGFIPCPLSFAMIIRAAAAPSPVEGGTLMLVFGLGTAPAMVLVGVAFGLLGGQGRVWLQRGAAILVIVMGLATIWQGFSYFDIMRGLALW